MSGDEMTERAGDTMNAGNFLEADASLKLQAGGFRFLEGPCWDGRQDCLIFSDIPGNALYLWSAATGVSMVRQNSFLANGNAIDHRGRLITCEHGTSRVSLTDVDGTYVILADSYEGKRLNSPNDVVVDSEGNVWFTDPDPGLKSRVGIPRPQILPFQGLYRLDRKTATLNLVIDDFSKPNGLCFSGDGSRLYVNDSDSNYIRLFQVTGPGKVSGGDVWAVLENKGPGVADGMKVAEDDSLWVCGPGGIHIFDKTGEAEEFIPMPEVAANLAWGTADRKTLFITATTGLYSLRTAVRGI
jgi:gluconolactonase